MAWIEVKKEISQDRFTKAYKEVLDTEPKIDKKSKIRYNIEKEVFDIPDAVADNAKMISLLISTMNRIYDVLPDTVKDNIQEEERIMIETTFSKFKQINTVADIQVANDGLPAISKLLERQQKISDIVFDKKEQ